MKYFLILILVGQVICAQSQITYLQSIDKLIVEASEIENPSYHLVQVVVAEYSEYISHIEEKIANALDSDEATPLEEDLKTLDKYLSTWERRLDSNPVLQLIFDYESTACYELETLNNGFFKGNVERRQEVVPDLIESDLKALKYSVHFINGGTEWVMRRTKSKCLSSDPNDCLVWCLVRIPEQYEIVGNQNTIKTEKLPENVDLLSNTSCAITFDLIYSIDRLFSGEEDIGIQLKSWREVDCAK